ncbi:hypothetical protein EG028_18370 [Chitinophaga barathri]|uniref:Uncharacterized protein n=1 Tax=Chitinophaga barathri TaxID=1647451 RepID=A0A3N4MW37_9BACT|nr:hypothetical protein EG028_18370 [Chitinophaga barathri]
MIKFVIVQKFVIARSSGDLCRSATKQSPNTGYISPIREIASSPHPLSSAAPRNDELYLIGIADKIKAIIR